MRGPDMYVVPYLMGAVGVASLQKSGIELTDSHLCGVSMGV